MSRPKKTQTMHIGSGRVPLGGDAYSADYAARVKAAGLDADDDAWAALSIDDRRFRLARKIAMFANKWTGCPETICQRMRGCMAPDIHCTNVPRLSQEELDARWPETQLRWRRALQKAKAHHERERARKARATMQGTAEPQARADVAAPSLRDVPRTSGAKRGALSPRGRGH